MKAIVVLAAAFTVAVLALPADRSRAARTAEIVFERRTGTGVGELYLVRADGSGLRKLGAGRADFDPAWSPDGTRIVFASDRSGGSGAHELFVKHADGTGLRRLTRRVQTATAWSADSAPAWSPDGRRIAFVRLEVRGSSSRSDVWVVNADGSELRRVTRTPGREAAPAWNGPALVFERGGTIYSLSIGAGGHPIGAPKRFARGSEPAFAPRGNGPFAFVRDGVVYATLGKHVRKVAAGSAPTWASDGTHLAYVTANGLFVVRADGTGRRRLTKPVELAHDLAPAWRP